jgi:hypothetical protein
MAYHKPQFRWEKKWLADNYGSTNNRTNKSIPSVQHSMTLKLPPGAANFRKIALLFALGNN